MKKYALTTVLLAVSTSAMSAPPPDLSAALMEWAGARSIARYQFSLVDLNVDGQLDAVVHVTDPSFCGNGGCPLVAFRKTTTSYELVASSGLVRKPIYLFEEMRDGWYTLAAMVGLGEGAGITPIRYKSQEQAYRSTPYLRAQVDLTAPMTKRVLNFEEVPTL